MNEEDYNSSVRYGGGGGGDRSKFVFLGKFIQMFRKELGFLFSRQQRGYDKSDYRTSNHEQVMK
jgi:hypothetical protein